MGNRRWNDDSSSNDEFGSWSGKQGRGDRRSGTRRSKTSYGEDEGGYGVPYPGMPQPQEQNFPRSGGSYSDRPERPSRAQEGSPAAQGVEAEVKFFNTEKGFGFVSPKNGFPDAFLHIAVLARCGFTEPPKQGATIVCDLSQSQRGLQVSAVSAVNESTAVDSHSKESFSDRSPRPATEVEGIVSFFDSTRGFGFVKPDGGGKDVFLHARCLEKSGLATIDQNQRVRVKVSQGAKGPQADHVSIVG